uniref:C3H1-type domain-containing protein n=1 Tax=Acrobeloides nanus TaxID=290746 RepID=A0A914DY67_9BILA
MATPFNMQISNSFNQNFGGEYNSFMANGHDDYSSYGMPSNGSTTNSHGANYLPYNTGGYNSPDTFAEPNNLFPVNSASDLEHLITATQKLYITLVKSAQEARDILKQKSNHWKNPALYKTTICDHWRAKKRCKYGPKCWYAHGTQELRYVPRLDQIPSLEALRMSNDSASSFDMHNMPIDVFQKGSSELFDHGRNSNEWSHGAPQHPPISYGSSTFRRQQQTLASHYPFDDQIGNQTSGIFSMGSTGTESLVSSPDMMPSPRNHTPTQQLFSQLTSHVDQGITDVSAIEKALEKPKQQTLGMYLEPNKIATKEWTDSGIQAEKQSNAISIAKTSDDSLFSKSFRPFGENYPLKSWM